MCKYVLEIQKKGNSERSSSFPPLLACLFDSHFPPFPPFSFPNSGQEKRILQERSKEHFLIAQKEIQRMWR